MSRPSLTDASARLTERGARRYLFRGLHQGDRIVDRNRPQVRVQVVKECAIRAIFRGAQGTETSAMYARILVRDLNNKDWRRQDGRRRNPWSTSGRRPVIADRQGLSP
jgi:hypothetical protein